MILCIWLSCWIMMSWHVWYFLYPKIHYIHCYWWTLIYKKCYEAFKSSCHSTTYSGLIQILFLLLIADWWFCFSCIGDFRFDDLLFFVLSQKCVWAKLYLALFNLFFADKILLSDFCSVITLTCFVSCIAYSFVWGLIFCYWWLVINFADCW